MLSHYYIKDLKALIYNINILHQYYINHFSILSRTLSCTRMKKLLIFLFLPFSALCQNTLGFPDIINYSKETYNAGLQNWDIRQDKNGIIYLANNEGLLSFDGRYWKLYPLPNKTIVRSVEIGTDNRIYVGGQDELGFFAPGRDGRLKYESLTHLLTATDKTFGDVWDIIKHNNEIYFRSSNRIFQLINGNMASYPAPLEWGFLGVCKNKLYAYDHRDGLLEFKNSIWAPLSIPNTLPGNDPITGMIPMKGDTVLITTLKHGCFLFSADGINKIQSPNSSLLENSRIYAAATVNTEWVAIATSSGGVYIIDAQENIIQSFSRTEGLQNNNVLSIFLDQQQNLWLGLDNGIDFIAYNSAIKHITPMLQDETGYSALIHDRKLYTGTSNGLYSIPLQDLPDLSFSKGIFSKVAGTSGQTWNLSEINNQLLLGHHEGAFEIKNNAAVQISTEAGHWNFTPLSSTYPASRIISGNYKGLFFFDYVNQQFKSADFIPGFTESCRFIAFDKHENIWVSHPYHGVYKLNQKPGGWATRIYSDKQGLPSLLNNHVYKIQNEVVIATEKGVYVYNNIKDHFEASPFYKNILGDLSVRYLKEDKKGNIWFIHDKTLGVIDLSEKDPHVIYLPELNNKMLSGFELIYAVDDNNVFLGGEKGFYHINYSKYKKKQTELKVQVRLVRIINKKDSLLFGGYFKGVNDEQLQQTGLIPKISYNWKTIHFEFTSALFGYQKTLEYSYRLKGFDQNWSEWTNRTEKEYTNLPSGSYTFEVKVRNNFGSESEAAAYSFEISPPWYFSRWAKFIYILAFVALLYGLYRGQRKKFLFQQKKHEIEQQKLLYIHTLERNKSESELVALRNEKLEAEINYKNSELASSAMHLVKKGELLTNIKSELTQVTKRLQSEEARTELKKMIKILGEDDNIDKEWENFAKHFDKVHSDFVVKLKEKHPAITGNELKLCAYLRMNLSTKEIAQLMNISVRGVEIGRYRLRKKLGIASSVNLFDYLISLV